MLFWFSPPPLPSKRNRYDKRKEEEGKRQKSKNCPFGRILRIISTSIFCCMVTLLGPSSIYTECKMSPKASKFAFINLIIVLWSWSVTMEKCHLSWDNFVVHDANIPTKWKAMLINVILAPPSSSSRWCILRVSIEAKARCPLFDFGPLPLLPKYCENTIYHIIIDRTFYFYGDGP